MDYYAARRATGRETLASLKRNLGRTFELRQLGAMLSAFAGKIDTTSDAYTWTLTTHDGGAK